MTTVSRSSRRAAYTASTLRAGCFTTQPSPFLVRRHDLVFRPIALFQLRNHASNNAPKPHDPETRKPNPYFALSDHGDGPNAPRSTLPPPLDLPSRDGKLLPIYLFKLGRAYGKFYWAGVKATWANHKLAKALKTQIRTANRDAVPLRLWGLRNPSLLVDIDAYLHNEKLSRGQFQLLAREQTDFRKLPLFGLLVCVFGEWLPLLVPFIPGAVPRTCRIPSQVDGMRKKIEERRKTSFRAGMLPPSDDLLGAIEKRIRHAQKLAKEGDRKARALGPYEEAATLDLSAEEAKDLVDVRQTPKVHLATSMMETMDRAQLRHVAGSLGVYGKMWDSLGLAESALLMPLLRFRVARRLMYLDLDDGLLLAGKKEGLLQKLNEEEVRIACEERGIDVTGRKEGDLRSDLGNWLEGRTKDQGYGTEVFRMLFRRPNTWS